MKLCKNANIMIMQIFNLAVSVTSKIIKGHHKDTFILKTLNPFSEVGAVCNVSKFVFGTCPKLFLHS